MDGSTQLSLFIILPHEGGRREPLWCNSTSEDQRILFPPGALNQPKRPTLPTLNVNCPLPFIKAFVFIEEEILPVNNWFRLRHVRREPSSYIFLTVNLTQHFFRLLHSINIPKIFFFIDHTLINYQKQSTLHVSQGLHTMIYWQAMNPVGTKDLQLNCLYLTYPSNYRA